MTTTVDDYVIGGEIVGAHNQPAKKFPVGRVCQQEGCFTTLSVYNSRDRCSVHDFDATLVHARVPGETAKASHGQHPRIWHEAA